MNPPRIPVAAKPASCAASRIRPAPVPRYSALCISCGASAGLSS